MSRVYAVGIDLGTSNSVAAYVTESGRTAIFPNEVGDYMTPSAVYLDDGETIVGRAALKSGMFEPDRLVQAAKRRLGIRSSAGADRSSAVSGNDVPAEVVQGCVLSHLKRVVESQCDGAYRAVVTVPAFFDMARRQAVRESAAVADLDVMDVVNEPTAAALSYGEQHGLFTNGEPITSQKLLIYDLGGGTFDVTVIELNRGEARTLATDGDVQLGGIDWDRRLADYMAQKFESQFRLDPRVDPLANARLMRQAEEVKHSLSIRRKAVVAVEYHQKKLELAVTREQFEILTSDFLERTAHTTRETLTASGLSAKQIDKIVLAGGSTRMPMVASMLEQLLGRVPDDSLNPDESVARGAAIYAALRLQRDGEDTPQVHGRVVDVNSHSLGIEGVDPVTGRKMNSILIPRNTPLPANAIHQFVTRKIDQETISIKVLEGEANDPDSCVLIGRASMRDVPPGVPRGTLIEAIFRLETDGLLLVTVRLLDPDRPGETLKDLVVELHRAGRMSDDRLRQWRSAVADGGLDRLAQVVREVLDVELPEEGVVE